MSKALILVLGDQLSPTLASLQGVDRANVVVVLAEVWDEATYVRHHQAKIALVFSAMRHFAEELRADGWQVDYVKLDDPANTGSLRGEVERALSRHQASSLRVVEPGEWRLQEDFEQWSDSLGCPVEILPDTRFLCSRTEFYAWAAPRKELRMEFFYRDMRRQTGLLMEGDKPVGGKWNYDAENRSGPPKGLSPPTPPRFAPDAVTQEVMALVTARFGTHFGSLEQFNWPVTAAEAERALDCFLRERLPDFGTWQDAMVAGQDFMFHGLISPAINLGLLDPLEVCRRAEAEYRAGRAPLNAVEGFIRQIIGWREYIRGMYWLEMPGLAEANALNAQRPLPEFFWTGETKMRCLSECVRTTREHAYAHHIQRLMVLGNFALLAGINPQEVSDWFLVVYADAFEWVELPNVAGMALHADGGRLASKPYAASGAYINRMSDYCRGCAYDVKQKVGPEACPFNALYWDFMARNEKKLGKNMRLANPYATWRRMSDEQRAGYRASAEVFLESLEPAQLGWAREVPTK
jgi:deoxyribodipyrimidine photolyase-related protein